jgi:hypothetical protein
MFSFWVTVGETKMSTNALITKLYDIINSYSLVQHNFETLLHSVKAG